MNIFRELHLHVASTGDLNLDFLDKHNDLLCVINSFDIEITVNEQNVKFEVVNKMYPCNLQILNYLYKESSFYMQSRRKIR